MKWSTDTPGTPPRLITEPLEHEPLDGEGWHLEHLGAPPKREGRTCLRCGGSPLVAWDPTCEHVTRADIRAGFVEDEHFEVWRPWDGSERVWCARDARRDHRKVKMHFHPIREEAIALVLDELVEREAQHVRFDAARSDVRQAIAEGASTTPDRLVAFEGPHGSLTLYPDITDQVRTTGPAIPDPRTSDNAPIAWTEVKQPGPTAGPWKRGKADTPRPFKGDSIATQWLTAACVRHATHQERTAYEATQNRGEGGTTTPALPPGTPEIVSFGGEARHVAAVEWADSREWVTVTFREGTPAIFTRNMWAALCG